MKEKIETDSLFVETMASFLNVYRFLRKYSRQLQSEGLSGREVSMLRYLLSAEPLTIGQCRDYLNINDSSTSEMIAHLEQGGVVLRTRSQIDNRSVMVTLTPAGRKLAHSVTLGGIPLLREKLKLLPPDRLQRIYDAMRDISELLEIKDEG
ncbi:MAG TPA: winged helix DNA-binding protein [Anaerolineae bacterium]